METSIEEKDSFTNQDREDISILFKKVNEELEYIEDRIFGLFIDTGSEG